jgi:microcystin-dependent protein
MHAAANASVGGSQPHPNVMPYLCTSFIIALQGIFPSRN